nr:MAG TPA: hypothetical protein [Caudoviricetes sp.]
MVTSTHSLTIEALPEMVGFLFFALSVSEI